MPRALTAALQQTLATTLETVATLLQQANTLEQQQAAADPQEPQLRPAHIHCCHQCPRRHECPTHRNASSSNNNDGGLSLSA